MTAQTIPTTTTTTANTTATTSATPADVSTRRLLACGIVATPLFFAVAFAQVFTRDGFDLTRHMISQLSLGHLGWVQIANFLLTGTLYVLCAVGLRRAGEGTWGPRLIGVFGAGLVAAGLFRADPAGGFPPGSADAGVSWHGVLHGVAALVAGLALFAATLVHARRFARQGRRGWAVASLGCGVLYLVFPWLDADLASLLLALGSVIGWSWVSALAARSVVARP